jgi:hypothetical protein
MLFPHAIWVGFSKGMGSNVWIFKVQNGEYGADEPQNFVRPSKQALE